MLRAAGDVKVRGHCMGRHGKHESYWLRGENETCVCSWIGVTHLLAVLLHRNVAGVQWLTTRGGCAPEPAA
jgi:hypothetical protein